ncbi:MAG: sugar transferase [Gammaproteobacteria bacterium]|nr:sugar transferase [Gammaproteobacteria bacterium]
MLKRIFDLIASLLAIILLSPLFFILIVLVRFSGKPVIYGHERVGLNGKSFKCLKFRSMVVDADLILKQHLESSVSARKEWEETFKLKDDPRVTRLGDIMRKTSLDELPQFFNVLRGDMSLVGPRPVIRKELDTYYDDFAKVYEQVRPGITGLWQVSGRSDLSYAERVKLDVRYVKNQSFIGDIIILFKTPYTLLTKKGAY